MLFSRINPVLIQSTAVNLLNFSINMIGLDLQRLLVLGVIVMGSYCED